MGHLKIFFLLHNGSNEAGSSDEMDKIDILFVWRKNITRYIQQEKNGNKLELILYSIYHVNKINNDTVLVLSKLTK